MNPLGPQLKVHSYEPFNAETPTEIIHKNPYSQSVRYVKNHRAPNIKPEDYKMISFIKNILKPILLKNLKTCLQKNNNHDAVRRQEEENLIILVFGILVLAHS